MSNCYKLRHELTARFPVLNPPFSRLPKTHGSEEFCKAMSFFLSSCRVDFIICPFAFLRWSLGTGRIQKLLFRRQAYLKDRTRALSIGQVELWRISKRS